MQGFLFKLWDKTTVLCTRLFSVSVGSSSAPASDGATWGSVCGAARVLDGLVYGQDEAGGLRRGRQGVDAHDGRLPDAGGEVVGDVLVVDVHAVPHTALQRRPQVSSKVLTRHMTITASASCPLPSPHLCVFGSQLVEDVGGVEARVVAQLPGDDLQGLGVRSDEQLLLSRDGPGIVAQVLGQLHLDRSSTRHN